MSAEHIIRVEHDLSEEALERLAQRTAEIMIPHMQREFFPHWLRADAAAEHLGVSRVTLDRWAARGLIERFKADQVNLYDVRSIRGNTPQLREVG